MTGRAKTDDGAARGIVSLRRCLPQETGDDARFAGGASMDPGFSRPPR
jgi:hypothetical protein